ncbi:MAG: ABC transporter ATP-binding protein [Elusimicrobia bacterium]|nr:ABC transporter ATP-binding protein [Elusimicrobiota bacterium]
MLKAENIFKAYTDTQKRVEVLRGISLEASPGETVGLVGPSGAGKSTLLHVLGGLDEPDQGRVLIGMEDIYRLKDGPRARLRNQAVGFVFQFYHLLPELTALENVLLPLMVWEGRLRDPRAMRSRAAEILDQVGLGHRLGHKPRQLSGGEQQRVAIARSVINRPRILLCDEPTGNLDSKTGAGVIDLLVSLARQNSSLLILVTHDRSLAQRCQKVVQIRDGVLA